MGSRSKLADRLRTDGIYLRKKCYAYLSIEIQNVWRTNVFGKHTFPNYLEVTTAADVSRGVCRTSICAQASGYFITKVSKGSVLTSFYENVLEEEWDILLPIL